MKFKEATDSLFSTIGHAAFAEALGVSVASVRQARLRKEAKAHRGPPSDWQDTVIRLAEERVWHYRKLIEKLHAQSEQREK
ncbi:MAG: hypothetical protein IIA72_13980 [Proteobacteria bacterium]|nr:hypothetical protein [Pseudomonadota bacterium]